MSTPSPHLLIAIPCRGEIRSCVFLDLVATILQAANYWARIHGDAARVSFSVHPRAHVVAARNAAVKDALEVDADWVLWLDDDMAPAPPHDLLERLHRTGCDFVGAVAYRRDPPYLPCVARIEDGNAVAFDPDPTQPLVRADLTGFACVLTHRRVLQAVVDRTNGKPFAWNGDEGLGEDYYFCMHARAAGVALHIVPDLVVGHATDLVVGAAQRRPYIDGPRPAAVAVAQPEEPEQPAA